MGKVTRAVFDASTATVFADNTNEDISEGDFRTKFDDVSASAAFLEDVNTFSKQQRWKKGADVASATVLPLIEDGNYFDVTGTVTVTSFADLGGAGTVIILQFDAACILTHHVTNLILPTGGNITTAAGDHAIFVNYASGDYRCVNYQRKDGTALVGGDVTKVGTPVNNQVGVWTSDGNLEGDSKLTFDGTTLGVTGGATFSGILTLGSTLSNGTYTYTLPGATGTLALTSDVTTAVANLVDTAPSTLDTLNELAAALGDDPNFATTVTNSIATKQPQLNGTGFVKISGTTISYDNSTYLTTASASSTYLPLTGGTLTGALSGTSASFSSTVIATSYVEGSYFQTGAVPATSGGLRLGTQVAIRARNVANTANIALIESSASDKVSIDSGGAGTVLGGALSGTSASFAGSVTITGANALRGSYGAGGKTTNFAAGDLALSSNTTGNFNTANGYSALENNTEGIYNTATGSSALLHNTTASNNTATGTSALVANTEGSENTAIGRLALLNNTIGSNNTALGYNTGLGITTGSGNTVLGASVTGLAAGLTNNIILANGTGAIKAQHDGTDWALTGGATFSGNVEVIKSSTPTIQLTQSGATNYKGYIKLAGNDLEIRGSSGAMEFYNGSIDGNSSALALSIDSTGAATFSGQINANNGISFPNQSAGSGTVSSSTLDAYEEGTWTPTFAGDTTAGTYTTSSVTATYTRIGNLCTVQCDTSFSAASGGTGSYIVIGGFPYSYNGIAGFTNNVSSQNLTYSGELIILPTGGGPGSTFLLAENNSGLGYSFIPPTSLTTSVNIRFTYTYKVS